MLLLVLMVVMMMVTMMRGGPPAQCTYSCGTGCCAVQRQLKAAEEVLMEGASLVRKHLGTICAACLPHFNVPA